MEARTMYPHLTSEQILAAHSYAKAHVEEIANDIREQSEDERFRSLDPSHRAWSGKE